VDVGDYFFTELLVFFQNQESKLNNYTEILYIHRYIFMSYLCTEFHNNSLIRLLIKLTAFKLKTE
jgi:hypothetical protein